jgi:ribosomal protein S27E
MPRSDNPLSQYFRQPAIFIRLPSDGYGWPAGALDMPVNREIPVYPMTAVDEITYRTPDALFNGEAVVRVIQSCVPAIKDAWQLPGTDLDAVLVAIRIASYGHSMDIDTQCPACENETTYGLDLRTVMDRMSAADYSQPLTVGDLTFYFRPLNYQEMNANSQIQFEQQRTLQVIGDAEASEQTKVEQLNIMMRRIVEATLHTVAQSTVAIDAAGQRTAEPAHIEEFFTNCDRQIFTRARDHLVDLKERSELRPLKLRCPGCQHEYDQAFTMDMARFFGSAS